MAAIIVDVPRGTGETAYLQKAIEGKDGIYMTGEEFYATFLRVIDEGKGSAELIATIFKGQEYIAIDGMDTFLKGRSMTQGEVARLLGYAAVTGKTLLLSGEQMQERAPVFCQELQRVCRKIQWIGQEQLEA